MINKYFKNVISLFLTVTSLIILTACQPTPDKPVIISKNENLEEKIATEETTPFFDNFEDEWCFEKNMMRERC